MYSIFDTEEGRDLTMNELLAYYLNGNPTVLSIQLNGELEGVGTLLEPIRDLMAHIVLKDIGRYTSQGCELETDKEIKEKYEEFKQAHGREWTCRDEWDYLLDDLETERKKILQLAIDRFRLDFIYYGLTHLNRCDTLSRQEHLLLGELEHFSRYALVNLASTSSSISSVVDDTSIDDIVNRLATIR